MKHRQTLYLEYLTSSFTSCDCQTTLSSSSALDAQRRLLHVDLQLDQLTVCNNGVATGVRVAPGGTCYGAAKGRKTPTKSTKATDFFARQTTDFVGRFYWQTKSANFVDCMTSRLGWCSWRRTAALYGHTGSTYLFVLCFNQALQFQKPKRKGRQI